jgi:protein-S-isoprenylcysteine O-methyltransferase Ste14
MHLFPVLMIVLQVLFDLWLVSEIAVAILTRTRRGGGSVRDRGTMALLWAAILTSTWLAVWIGNTTPRNMFGAADWVRITALGVLIAGLALRWTAIFTLGRAFSANVAIRADQRVYKHGLFRWMRHPSYTGLMLCLLAVGLANCNWLSLLLATIPPYAALLYRIHVEEIALREHFGAEYVEYSRVTKRLVPGVY